MENSRAHGFKKVLTPEEYQDFFYGIFGILKFSYGICSAIPEAADLWSM